MIEKRYQVIRRQKPWRDAFYYQKSEVIYQLTRVFCQRFLPAHGDRTVDQMIQAARSGKQNIVEGTEDGSAVGITGWRTISPTCSSGRTRRWQTPP